MARAAAPASCWNTIALSSDSNAEPASRPEFHRRSGLDDPAERGVGLDDVRGRGVHPGHAGGASHHVGKPVDDSRPREAGAIPPARA